MSNTENKIEEKKAVDTAPYLKKPDSTKPSKSNFVIPLVLLVVSAIVIVATFYQEEYSNFVAEIDLNKADTETSNTQSNSVETSTIETSENENEGETTSTNSSIVASTKLTTASDDTAEADLATNQTTADEKQAVIENNVARSATEGSTTLSATATEATDNTDALQNNLPAQQLANSGETITSKTVFANANTPETSVETNHAYRQNRNAQAQQRYTEMMQQRQKYQAAMQARKQQYEAAMQARQEQRAQYYETQKAVFQRAENRRLETAEKVRAIHMEIEKLHKELHQLMQQNKMGYRKPMNIQAKDINAEQI